MNLQCIREYVGIDLIKYGLKNAKVIDLVLESTADTY